jgi:tetratricopeptide (TPR) repeat protein
MDKTKKSASINSPIEASRSKSGQVSYGRLVQNFLLIWLDGSSNDSDSEECCNTIAQLQQAVNTVNTFTDTDQCINFISSIKEENAFMISSGALGRIIIPIIHDKPQVSTIYIYCGDKTKHEKWAKKWSKVKGVFTEITPICEALKQAIQEYDQNSVYISFVKSSDGTSTDNLDQLDQSFMYTQILKEILLEIDFEPHHFNEFVTYCREQFINNRIEIENVEKLRIEYLRHRPIWWFTYDCFLYSMLNKALRTMEVDLIIKMGFFVRDLHKDIAQLHSRQYGGRRRSDSFIVYRGQGVSQKDFDQLMKTKGGLLSFNAFLSTSKDRRISLDFAQHTMENSNMIGILFVMMIDPSIHSTSFANVRDVSAHATEEEILFSMHSVFRIERIQQIDKNSRLWEVDLTLTSDNDPQLHALTESMRNETSSVYKGWDRLGMLLIKLGNFNKAEELYELLLEQTTDQSEQAYILHHLGRIKNNQGKYTQSIAFYEKSIAISQKILSPNHSDLATVYNNIGLVYRKMGDYSMALSYYEKDLGIKQEFHPSNHPSLATSHNNIGSVYHKMNENSKALSSHKKALEIRQKTLPPNHPDLAVSHNNIGSVYNKMGEYSKALASHEKALEIGQKTLLPNHPDLATPYTNIGSVYFKMGEYSRALSFFERAVDIGRRSLPANHPRLQQWENNLDIVKKKL